MSVKFSQGNLKKDASSISLAPHLSCITITILDHRLHNTWILLFFLSISRFFFFVWGVLVNWGFSFLKKKKARKKEKKKRFLLLLLFCFYFMELRLSWDLSCCYHQKETKNRFTFVASVFYKTNLDSLFFSSMIIGILLL